MPTKTPLTLEHVAHYPLPGMAIPGLVAFRPDDRLITYLWSAEGSLSRALYAFDPETGTQQQLVIPTDGGNTEENISLDEALRRERQRQLEVGITRYAWAKHANRLLIPLRGAIYVQDDAQAPLRRITPDHPAPAIDPHFSPDGEWVAYVMDAELYVVSVAGGAPRQITEGARGTGKTHGLAEYIAQEEMKRSRGFWWSDDSHWLAFAEVDERHIPIYRIVHQGKDQVGEGAQEDHRYPFAGQPNAIVRLGILPREGGTPRWIEIEPDHYLARVQWLPDGGLSIQVQNRKQSRLRLMRIDPHTGATTTLLEEYSEVWINLHHSLVPLEQPHGAAGRGFLWASERSGFRHIYLYSAEGHLVRQVTEGDWMVDAILAVDEAREVVYFTGTRDDPREQHLYRVPLWDGLPQRLTREPGIHNVVIDHGCQRFLDLHHSAAQPPRLTLRNLDDGALVHTIFTNSDPRLQTLDLQTPELVSLQNRAGVTLYGAIYRPPAACGPGPYPTLISVYGGPGAQRVSNSWGLTVTMRAQYLASQGFLVFALDNRGTARRGLAFEGAIKHHLGEVEVQDQVDGVRWLVQQGLADPDRVGIYGWSYGGYVAAMCLANAGDTFHVAVVGAPVTHWDGYDTHYTERYMGTPQQNPTGYTKSSVLAHAAQIQGPLLMVHGLIDENVHFRHTARLINALIAARKRYELLLFPDERHTPRREGDRIFMEERIHDFFQQHLALAVT